MNEYPLATHPLVMSNAGSRTEKKVRPPRKRQKVVRTVDSSEEEDSDFFIPPADRQEPTHKVEKVLDHRKVKRPLEVIIYEDGTEDIVGNRPDGVDLSTALNLGDDMDDDDDEEEEESEDEADTGVVVLKLETTENVPSGATTSTTTTSTTTANSSEPIGGGGVARETPVDSPLIVASIRNTKKEKERVQREVEIYEYLIKWKNRANIHNTWETEEGLRLVAGYRTLKSYMKRQEEDDRTSIYWTEEDKEQRAIEKEMYVELQRQWVQVDRVLDVQYVEETPEEAAQAEGQQLDVCCGQGQEKTEASSSSTFDVKLDPNQASMMETKKKLYVELTGKMQELETQYYSMRLAIKRDTDQENQHAATAHQQRLHALHAQVQQQTQRIQNDQTIKQSEEAVKQVMLQHNAAQYYELHQYHTQQQMRAYSFQQHLDKLRSHYNQQKYMLQQVYRKQETELHRAMQPIKSTAKKKQNENAKPKYLVKWKGLGYNECTWEAAEDILPQFKDKVDQYLEFKQSGGYKVQRNPTRRADYAKEVPTTTPHFITGELRDYQLVGLNWLIQAWAQNINPILGDEMGLGKTIQTISFISYLVSEVKLPGPYLVVVPLSTVHQWTKEFAEWAPQLYMVGYVGMPKARAIIHQYELWVDASKKYMRANVVLTTYEYLLKDAAQLRQIPWCGLVIDEAHHFKTAGKLYQELCQFDSNNFRLLLTGTPLQTNLKELYGLLHLLMPQRFRSVEDFEAKYNFNLNCDTTPEVAKENAEKLKRLHEDLRSVILRRMKADVEQSLPRKNERVLKVGLSALQRRWSKALLSKFFPERKPKDFKPDVKNLLLLLKKVASHPYLFDGAEQNFLATNKAPKDRLRAMIEASGKLALLDKLLENLKATDHRVLIFSPTLMILDLIVTYLGLKGYPYQRLDGNTPQVVRQGAVAHFNDLTKNDFCFVLSTRAGGVGLNLTAADTVILFDPDWNPQNDVQAVARAHRIGQKNVVNIYRLVTGYSIEVSILERAQKKMKLAESVNQGMMVNAKGQTVLNNVNSNKERQTESTVASKFTEKELRDILTQCVDNWKSDIFRFIDFEKALSRDVDMVDEIPEEPPGQPASPTTPNTTTSFCTTTDCNNSSPSYEHMSAVAPFGAIPSSYELTQTHNQQQQQQQQEQQQLQPTFGEPITPRSSTTRVVTTNKRKAPKPRGKRGKPKTNNSRAHHNIPPEVPQTAPATNNFVIAPFGSIPSSADR